MEVKNMTGFIIARFDRVKLYTKLWHRGHPTLPFTERICVVGYNPRGRIAIAPWCDWSDPYFTGDTTWFDEEEFDNLNLLMEV